MKNICHLTSVHNRYDIRIFIKQCKSLAELDNYKINLIVADGLDYEEIDNVFIYDVGKPKSILNRILSSSMNILSLSKKLNCDIYHFHDPELILVGIYLKWSGKKVIYDIHENLHQQIKLKTWIPKTLRYVVAFSFNLFENYFSKKFNALIVPQPSMLGKYQNINNNTVIVENFVILEDNKLVFKDYKNKNAFHAGVLNKNRGLYNMINAYNLLGKSNNIYLAGNVNSSKDLELLKGLKDSNIIYLGLLSHDETIKIYNESSIGLILYNNVGQYNLSYSIKLFEYMNNSIPIIMPNFGDWLAFNKENNCGINVNTSDSIEVSNAINFLNDNIDLKRQLGENGKKAVIEKYNWAISKNKLFNLYNNL